VKSLPTASDRKHARASATVRLSQFVKLLPAFVLILVCLFPYIWMVLASFKTRVVAQHVPPKWVFSPTTVNYQNAFINGTFAQNGAFSAAVACISTTLALALALPAAYALSQLRVDSKRRYEFFILATRMVPPVSLALPLYSIFATIGLRDTLLGLALAHVTFNVSFSILILKGFYDAIPGEIIEAARLDGLGHIVIVTRIARSFILPGVAVAAVFSAIFSWNDFFFAKVLVDQQGTLPIAILGLDTVHGTEWGQLSAVCTVMTLPMVLFAWLVQKHIVRGLSYGFIR
jgi:multiple sugar transport system permease protein